jgi:hypothetical protein
MFDEGIVQQRKIKTRHQAQINHDAEVTRKLRATEVPGFLEAQRLENERITADTMIAQQSLEAQIEHMIETDSMVKEKAIELIANKKLTVEERSVQLADL